MHCSILAAMAKWLVSVDAEYGSRLDQSPAMSVTDACTAQPLILVQ